MRKFYDSLILFFEASFGNYDLSVFDVFLDPANERRVFHYAGKVFVLSFVFLNALILLNVVIAMMADTYSLMTSVR